MVCEATGCGHGASNIRFCALCYSDCSNLTYCYSCQNCSDCFGCIGLRKKQYCILNKQYNKEEYEALVPKIIDHMNTMPFIDSMGRVYKFGEYFPTDFAIFCYNETPAQEFFPLSKEQALAQGYKWKESEPPKYQPTILAKDLPDNINNTDDSVLNQAIACADEKACLHQCTGVYRIIPKEVEFLRKMNIPLPTKCPNCRHFDRLKLRNPFKLWHRKCMKQGCGNEFETSYAPDRPEIVYCESCYQQEVA